jgi:hypothetical protein
MPWWTWNRKKGKREKKTDVPPAYVAARPFSLTLAAEKSLLQALTAFRKRSTYERNAHQVVGHVVPGALVNIIEINLGLLNRSLNHKTIRRDRIDWYSEMVVEHKVAYNHPDLIHKLIEEN